MVKCLNRGLIMIYYSNENTINPRLRHITFFYPNERLFF